MSTHADSIAAALATLDRFIAALNADFLGRAGDGWHESRWDERTVIHAGPDKVHFAVKFSRWRADGSLIGAYQSIYIVTLVTGKWGIQARSSFAA